MLQKARSTQAPQNDSLSFEQLLGWFGRFTPQFKFRMMGIRRQLKMNEFDLFIRETLTVFRDILVNLGRLPKGPERARAIYKMIDAEYNAAPPTGVSCAASCSACCHFKKQITDDEADLLADLVKSGQAQIDLTQLQERIESHELTQQDSEPKGTPQACLFLGADQRCTIYADRPSTCRKYHVISPKENCSSDEENVIPKIDLMPELIVSAAMSLSDNGIGLMEEQLMKRLLP